MIFLVFYFLSLLWSVPILGTSIRSTCFQPCQEYVKFRPIILKFSVVYLVYPCYLKKKGHRFEPLKSFLNVFSCFFLSNLLTNRPKFCCLFPAFNFIGPALIVVIKIEIKIHKML